MDLFKEAETIREQPLSFSFVLAFAIFLIAMLLDMVTTQYFVANDLTLEGNPFAATWYSYAGALSFLEIIIWPMVVATAALIIHTKSEFFALWYLYWMAASHFLGWLTWTHYSSLINTAVNVLHQTIGFELILIRPVGLMGLALGLILVLLHRDYFKDKLIRH